MVAAAAIIALAFIPASASHTADRVYLSVRLDTVYDESEIAKKYNSPVIIEKTGIPYTEGMTAFDAFKSACDKNGTEFEFTGDGDNLYISSVDSVAEFDFGPLSGWMYSVNGYFPSVSAGAYDIYPGDEIKFEYTENLGNDLETQ